MLDEMFESRVKIQQIIQNHLPEFILDESPKFPEFLKQYYISQEFQGGAVDIAENLDQYIKLDNLTPEVISGSTNLLESIESGDSVIVVGSTKGFPKEYGLLKIDDEIITYTGITTNSFTGCIRGFSGITDYHQQNNPEELVFSSSESSSHENNSTVINLSSLFLQEFYKKIKFTLTPGLENSNFVEELDVSNFIKEARTLYQAKGTEESFRILFKVLFNKDSKIIDLENFLIKPSSSEYIRREIVLAERIYGNPLKLVGQTIKRTKDENTQAAVSEVEILTRQNKSYYKLSLFVGFDQKALIDGQFKVAGKTKTLEKVSIGSSVINVDSTIGFEQSGTIVTKDGDQISYTNKSVNQFFGCNSIDYENGGIKYEIPIASDIKSDETIYGYEEGDLNKKVELRITGVLSDFIPLSDNNQIAEGNKIYVKSIGDPILNEKNSYKQIFANSWIYNTSCRYELDNFSGSTSSFSLKVIPDKSSLKIGDIIEIIERGSNIVLFPNEETNPLFATAKVTAINVSNNGNNINIILDKNFTSQNNKKYDLRRKIKKSSSSVVPLDYNNQIVSNIQNLYIDNDLYAYVASNGLPEYSIQIQTRFASFDSNENVLGGFSTETENYSTITFQNSIRFLTGDSVIYQAENSILPGLSNNTKYYVEVIDEKTIRLYTSRSFIGSDNFIGLRKLPSSSSGTHKFVLERDTSNLIKVKKNLKKFPLNLKNKLSSTYSTSPGPVGMLINGVEIISPKSKDKIFYGPLETISILNSGENYDVVNPPQIVISEPKNGTKALAQPVMIGSIVDVFVDQQDFDLSSKDNIVATIIGGNGSGAILQPVVSERYREIELDARQSTSGGGVNISNDTLSFSNDHNLSDGDLIIYNSNGNLGIGVGTYFGGNEETGQTLVNNLGYYVKKVTDKTIKLHNSLSDVLSGINTVGFTTENTSGVHNFKTLEKYTLRSIKVINSGSGYQNRKLHIKPTGISTSNSTINFINHGFKDGELVTYSNVAETSPIPISGLSTTNQYYIIKIDDNSFRLSDAGIGASISSNYERRNYVTLSSSGSGYHIFSYPPIQVSISGIFNSQDKSVIATPIVRGSITDVYLYESGTGYGSTIINFEKKPIIRLATGKEAEVFPIIKNGKIIDVTVNFGGYEYYSVPDLIVSGTGSGAKLRAIISNQKLIDVVIINSGQGYDNTTKITVSSPGKNAILDTKVRKLTINERTRHGLRYGTGEDELGSDEIYVEDNDFLNYGIISYPNNPISNQNGTVGIATIYLDDVEKNSGNSPIIGWAYDGNPIYGPYAPSDPTDTSSTASRMRSGYKLDKNKLFDRPLVSNDIIFIEDYVFEDNGDLDEHNGRFACTREFPNGIYAYHATINSQSRPSFPYFIGNTYKSALLEENDLLNQEFNFENSSLIRNTFPYGINQEFIDNDFITESNEILEQSAVVENVTKGVVDEIKVVNSGDGYKVNEKVIFDNSNTFGGGIEAKVSEIKGKDVTQIVSSVSSFSNAILIWNENEVLIKTNQEHNFIDGDYVSISGLSTYVNSVTGSHKIGVTTESLVLLEEIPSSSGIITDIYVSSTPTLVSVGSSLLIGNEILQVLNVYNKDSVIRVKRSAAVTHLSSKTISIIPNTFKIPVKTSYFDSKINAKVYFNPNNSLGIGTVRGVGVAVTYNVGIQTNNVISIPTQSIYIPNHPFKTGQKVIFTKGTSQISVSNTSTSTPFSIPFTGDTQEVYIINKSKDFIGITTIVGLTTSSNGLFFITSGSNEYEYSFETQYPQVKCNVNKIKATVSVSTAHSLLNNDLIKLTVVPNLYVGIGSSDKVRLQYNSQYDKILINPIGFTSLAVNKSSDTINLPSHGYQTGDKVFYQSLGGTQFISGINTGTYFVYKIDDNNIQLGKTLYDVTIDYPNIIGISSEGGNNHSISLVNPKISATKNSKLVFDLSDSSVSGYKFKLFYDKNFNDEFVSTGENKEFNLVSIGTSSILNYSYNLPTNLYYSLSKNGSLVLSDKDVDNYSQIEFVDSVYNNSYRISGAGLTTFDITLEKIPERSVYYSNQTEKIEYVTKSTNTTGGISNIKLISGGLNYKKLPTFSEVNSVSGIGANLVPVSKNIGKIQKVRFLEQGFDYPSDNTLNPIAEIPPIVYVKNSNTIEKVDVVYGGKNYIIPPSLVVYNTETNKVVDNSSLSCIVTYTAINSVQINSKPYGLDNSLHKVIALNNTNGIGINSVTRLSPTSYIISLTTPIVGYASSLFGPGDEVFIEGIGLVNGSGSGYNSSDYGYKFLKVLSFDNTVPAKVTIDVSGLTNEIGISSQTNENFASIINKKDYPEFNVILKEALFRSGEKLLVSGINGFDEKDLYVIESKNGFLTVRGGYTLQTNAIIKGKISGVVATVYDITYNKGIFEIDYSNEVNYGWITDIGKLSETYQVCPDNNYYQNLSYTVKSEIEFERMIDPVNRLLHTSGLKNFADTEVISKVSVGIGSTSSDLTVLDILEEKRVDTINNYDFAYDIDTKGSYSKFIKLKNKKISDYFKCLSNRVLVIDDISNLFNDNETNQTFFDKEYRILDSIRQTSARYLIQIRNPNTSSITLSELILILKNNSGQIEGYILDKGMISSLGDSVNDNFGELEVLVDEFNSAYLIFKPSLEYLFDNDLDIKILKTSFDEYNNLVGFSSSKYQIGFSELNSYQNQVGTGKTDTLSTFNKNNYQSFFANIFVEDKTNNNINYIEIFASHDGTDVSSAEYFFDTNSNINQDIIGTFEPKLVGSQFKLDFYNNQNTNVIVNSKVVGFGSTATDTYNFLSSDGAETSAIIQVEYDETSSIGNVITIDNSLFTSIKSVVRVSYGQTSALHQILVINDNQNAYLVEYPYVSIGHTAGIGTFGIEKVGTGSTTYVKFFVDPDVNTPVEIRSYNEIFYKVLDTKNEYGDLEYSPIREKYSTNTYNAINGNRINQVSFEMKHKQVPIFTKSFVPYVGLNTEKGIFSIKDHFFSPSEKVFYSDGTTVGSSSPIRITPSYPVPNEVYIVPIDKDNFGIATTKENALAGTYITGFSTCGIGNSHVFEMEKKNEKSIISIDGVVQKPLTYTPISYSLESQVSGTGTYFALSGISSIFQDDILKVQNEYMKVLSVGLGTTSLGPVIQEGEYKIVNVDRGLFDSPVTSHSVGTPVRLYQGAFNIIRNKLYFVSPPRGAGIEENNESNLPYPTSSFSGRVYLQKDYTNNKIFDDISSEFNGIGRTFSIFSNGVGVTGINTGGGFVFINNIFQIPTTSNNSNNNFEIIKSSGGSGICSARFSGITTQIGGPIIITDYDINQNQLPRGGIVVSLGSTPGLGFAPLVGASVTATVGAGGSISFVGIGSTGSFGSGYNRQVSVAITDTSHTGTAASIRASIGVGGTLSFSIIEGGSGYVNPVISVSQPSYENMEVVGVSRIGVGTTTITGDKLLVDLVVGPAITGIGTSSLFEVKSFKIVNAGYGYEVGDVLKPIGLVTDKSLSSPIIDFYLTVTQIFTDSFYGFDLGQFDYIDSIKLLQDGSRTIFPLLYNGELRSFEKDFSDPTSSLIDLESCFLVFVNGVIQEPGSSYKFDGGTSIEFFIPPKSEDDVAIFFYQGNAGTDIVFEDIIETIKPGDIVQLNRNSLYPKTITQSPRVVENIESSDQFTTNLYSVVSKNEFSTSDKPVLLSWTKQKVDRVISGQNTYKVRESIEPLFFPTANIIKNLSTSDNKIFIDSPELFRYDFDPANFPNGNEGTITYDPLGEVVGAVIVPNTYPEFVSAAFTATVGSSGTITAVTITNPGFGYTESSLDLVFSKPYNIGVGIGTTIASGTVTIVNGSVSSVSISSVGSGYSITNPPQVTIKSPSAKYEQISSIIDVRGYSGIITGISTVSVGSSNKITFYLSFDNIYSEDSDDLKVGYPIYIKGTGVGKSCSSLNVNDLSIVGVGNTFLDNIYVLHEVGVGETTAVVSSYINTSLSGVNTTGSINKPLGSFSWGVINLGGRTNPISVNVSGFNVSSGLSSFPVIQRRLFGLRSGGALKD